MRVGILFPLFLMAACGTDEKKCNSADEVGVFADADGDGFGGSSAGVACEPGEGQVLNEDDCDDTNAEIRPTKTELCNGFDDDCDGAIDQGFNLKVYYQDLDTDLFGNEDVPLTACKAPDDTWTQEPGDCDDSNAGINPGAVEICSGLDEDCDLLVDQDDDSLDETTLIGFYPDEDMDGYGATGPIRPACDALTTTGLVDNNLDCNDRDVLVNPLGLEICNGEVDDDCDGLIDDLDDSLDLTTQVEFFADVDGDGAGDPYATTMLCAPRPGLGVVNSGDCNDAEALMSPSLNEVLCDVLDNDCDPLTLDDRDFDVDTFFVCVDDCNDSNPNIHPGAPETPADQIDSNCDLLEECHQDVDMDGARTDVTVSVLDFQCTNAPNVRPVLPIDCDDNDPLVDWSGDWVSDSDFDGFGDGVIALQQCTDPGPGFLLVGGEIDCDDGDPSTYPGALDSCNDGTDGDCDGTDSCETCAAWLLTDGALPSGLYEIRPDFVTPFDVYCDMVTDGGGWTLVSSSFNSPVTDSSNVYYPDLQDLTPAQSHTGVWNGLRNLLPANADVRFACKLSNADVDFEVDLSFYDVPWYAEITAGTDSQSCFAEGGNPESPARQDNIAGLFLAAGDPYDGGGLEGEDLCNDTSDFTVDFDDAGMDGNQADGTDWGEDDGKEKCGVSEAGQAWFIFAR